ncbi:MAG: DUF4258 domain-containing protein [Beijerinckiaceae bacterium]
MCGPRPLKLTQHAAQMLLERNIELRWVIATIGEPDYLEPDPAHERRLRTFRRIPENGNRWLRVVYELTEGEPLLVTAFFDRNAGRSK